ncbi:MAG: hypothetical protein C0606_01390 [Hyphomicrobiales bacterium]|nr:MAG: hypothetical protein C0606_01390 [Hyphomicrobiales bacterium]
MRAANTTWVRALVIGAGVLALAGCETVSDFNPFSEKEKILPGERQPLYTGADPLDEVAGATSVSPGGQSDRGSWTQSGGNAANYSGHVALGGGGGARTWKVQAGAGGGSGFGSITGESLRVTARPVAYGGNAYVYDPRGKVTAVSLGGGRRWTVNVRPEGEENDNAAGGGVAADNGRVFVSTAYGEVIALDAGSGQKVWTAKLHGPARTAPSAADGKVFVATQNNEIYALNQSDGSELWTYRGIAENAGLLQTASPAVSSGIVVVPSTSGEIVALSTSSGDFRWSDMVSRSFRTEAVSGLADVSASPVIADGVVYAAGVGGRTIAVNLKSGSRLWEEGVGSMHTPVVSGEAVFMVDIENRAVALSRKTGKPLWVTELPRGEKKKRNIWAGPVLAGGALWFVSNRGDMIAINASNGTAISSRKIGSSAYVSPIAVSGQILVLFGDGALAAYR